MISKELHFEYGTTSTFKKVQTRRERETKDHLTLGFGVGVGLPFLAAASVKGDFDQNIEENTDVSQDVNTAVTVKRPTLLTQKYSLKRSPSTQAVAQEPLSSRDSLA
jgi:hypothetical protein